jgi:hypothetical protein
VRLHDPEKRLARATAQSWAFIRKARAGLGLGVRRGDVVVPAAKAFEAERRDELVGVVGRRL